MVAHQTGLTMADYERHGIVEYWFVDLDRDVVEVHRLAGGGFDPAQQFGRGQLVESAVLPGPVLHGHDLLGPSEGDSGPATGSTVSGRCHPW